MYTLFKQKIFQRLRPYMQIISNEHHHLCLIGPMKMPLDVDGNTYVFSWYTWVNHQFIHDAKSTEEVFQLLFGTSLADHQLSSVLVYGDFQNEKEAFVRFHSICHTGDVFSSKRCDCGEQFQEAKKRIVKEGCGAIFYLANQEGRGIGLFHKAMTYLLQEQGFDTIEANEALEFKDEMRQYDESVTVLKALRNMPIHLITNNPNKLKYLQQSGVTIERQIPVWCQTTPYNKRYIETKITRSGHIVIE